MGSPAKLESGTGAMGRGLLQIYRESSVSDIFSFLDGSGEEIDVTDPQPEVGDGELDDNRLPF